MSELCGLHAQVMSSAELTLWARVEDLEPDAVSRALWQQRSLVKTWAMRGTLHMLPAAEMGVWAAALGTRIERHFLNNARLRAFGTTREETLRLIDAIGEALDGRELTRAELAEAVGDDRLRESWGAMRKPAAAAGLLCFAPSLGPNVRFTRPDWPEEDAAGALERVTRRYLTAGGPATREDLARWWGVSPAEGGRMLAALGDELTEAVVEDEPMWMLRADAERAAGAEPAHLVRLLPGFDQFVIASTLHAERLMPGPFKARVHRPQGWISPVLCVDGKLAGVWRHERKRRRLLVTLEPFATLPVRARKGAEAEAERLAAFLGGALEVSWEA
ncbi:MAG TPA: winged helix DNA-binding domain-containing protein [Solirubrobacteraceae bacterium]|nr:winged helix DNA-binding domain-containing protein [Solirubrobacteraceae bacterium]